ncbi:hypothetical protein H6A12_09755 [Phocea massiliensis]|uniref:DUF975 family protein n=1 Tax=Merdimmobilis hominis TaxID=2897707 RepID=A0A938X7U8_9FIRM|nr:hypothetical protein [Merdimmobilis hominis]MBM6921438.1 hypothetical protein [Merdimmobilis hominis]
MTTNEIAAASGRRMRGVMTPAASLVMISLLVLFGSLLSVSVCRSFFQTLLFESEQHTGIPVPISALFGTLALLLLCLPLYLNLKRWIVLLDDGFVPLRCAFSYFSSFAQYKKALCFSALRACVSFLFIFVCFLPSSLLLSIVSNASPESGLFVMICLVLCAVLFLLGCFFCYYTLAGLFLSDYLFILNEEISPAAAIRRSFRLMRGHRLSLLRVIAYRIPYLLLSIFIVTLPLTVPIIESTFAVFANSLLSSEPSDSDASMQ